jgi:hypothetical protein
LFTWATSANATSYQIDVSTSNTFATIAYTANGITTTSHTATLNGNATYYWRVRGMNACGNGTFSSTKNFIIPNINCNTFMSTDVVNKTIGANANTVTTSNLNITGTGTIVDLNVVSLTGTHSYISDLVFKLKSPANLEKTLISNICGNNADFKIGFDDASSNLYSTIPCPATDSLMYQSLDLLSSDFTLSIKDVLFSFLLKNFVVSS